MAPRGLLIAESRVRWREGAVSRRLLDQLVLLSRSVAGGERPAEAGELARDGDRDQGAALAAL